MFETMFRPGSTAQLPDSYRRIYTDLELRRQLCNYTMLPYQVAQTNSSIVSIYKSTNRANHARDTIGRFLNA